MKRSIVAGAVGLLALMGAAPALAQTTTTNYQPNPCTASTFLGSAAPGGTINGTLGPDCQFTGPVTMTVNGASGGPKQPNTAPNKGVPVSLQIVTTTQGLLNDPVSVPVHLGTNNISATGPTAQGPVTVNGTFAVNAPQTATTAGPVSNPPASRVAFTGANILRWSLAAVALLGIGALLVFSSRRRRPTSDR